MELIRELMALQAERGWLDEEALRSCARRHNVPLYRLGELISFYPHLRGEAPAAVEVAVCRDICCWMAGSDRVLATLQREAAARDDLVVRSCSCLGRCDAAPAALVNDRPVSLADVVSPRREREAADVAPGERGRRSDETSPASAASATPSDARAAACGVRRGLAEQLLARAGRSGGEQTPGASGPTRRWRIDPYADGAERYRAARSVAALAPKQRTDRVLDVLEHAALRGMGGAGFPTARKWRLVSQQHRTPKYVICNADESEPGTFKDRVILAELSHLVVEGLVLAGLTVGAERGIVFIRHEYAPELAALKEEIERAQRAGVLGADAAGSGQPFDIEVFVSPGGYILGEETALLECLEDRRGEPRNKPPYPGEVGLWGCPTLVNNVETLALAAAIMAGGVDWWCSLGRGDASGIKFVSVSGDVQRPGVFEVPYGTPFSEIIALAGGVRGGRAVRAFLPGGASSRFLPGECLNLPLDYDAVRAAGSMLGTAAVIVLDESRDVLVAATRVLEFFRNESCGKCVPCRIGTQRGVELLHGMQPASSAARPNESPADALPVLHQLGATLKQTSICGLGQVAFDAVLSALELQRKPHESAVATGGSGVGVSGPAERRPPEADAAAERHDPERDAD